MKTSASPLNSLARAAQAELDRDLAALRIALVQITEAAETAHGNLMPMVQTFRKLSATLPTQLAAIADAAVYRATRTDTYPVVAEQLGISVKGVEKAVRQHRARHPEL